MQNGNTAAGVKGNAIIVGASLAGLMAGIALAEEGVRVCLLEKVGEEREGGSGLRVDGGTFGQTKTERLLKQLVSGGKSSVQLWSSIEYNLRNEAKRNPFIELRYNTRIERIGQDSEHAYAITDQGETIRADLLIGADGHSSQVRAHIAPHKPDATYAGYMGWLASMEEEDLPKHLRLRSGGQTVDMFGSSNGFKFGSVIEVRDPEGNSGKRRIGCTWYDNTQSEMLRKLGCVEGNVVRHSLRGQDIPEGTLRELRRKADRWPEPWRSAAIHGIETRTLVGIPIKEYVPEILADGRIAIVGDAAHVPAPVTASGFNESLQDAVILGECAAGGIRGESAIKALAEYEKRRLHTVRRMVQSGHYYTWTFGQP